MQRGNYYHGTSHNPTAAVNLFLVGKQYLTFCTAKAPVTRNLIGRKTISNVKRSDTRNSLGSVAFVKRWTRLDEKYCKRHTLKSQTPEHVRVLATERYVKRQVSVIRTWSAISLSDGI